MFFSPAHSKLVRTHSSLFTFSTPTGNWYSQIRLNLSFEYAPECSLFEKDDPLSRPKFVDSQFPFLKILKCHVIFNALSVWRNVNIGDFDQIIFIENRVHNLLFFHIVWKKTGMWMINRLLLNFFYNFQNLQFLASTCSIFRCLLRKLPQHWAAKLRLINLWLSSQKKKQIGLPSSGAHSKSPKIKMLDFQSHNFHAKYMD